MTPEKIKSAVRVSRNDFFARLRTVQFTQEDEKVICRIEATRQNICEAESEGLMVRFFQIDDNFYTEISAKPPIGFETRKV